MANKSKSLATGATSGTLADDMTCRYGPMMGGKDLIQALGYGNGQAFRQALRQGRLGVPVFNLPARQGKFALTIDIAAYIQSASETR